MRNPVKNNLGFWEVRDQINAARFVFCLLSLSSKEYSSDIGKALGCQTIRGSETDRDLGMGASSPSIDYNGPVLMRFIRLTSLTADL